MLAGEYILIDTIDRTFNTPMTNFIVPHKEEWKFEFDKLKNFIESLLNRFQVDIQHVGSTAIPELFAKPILDIDIIIINKKNIDDISAKLEKVGYKNKGEQGISGRFTFRQTSDLTPLTGDTKKWQEHHLYVCYSDSLALKNHILFRDALLNDKKLVTEYSKLKTRLVAEKGMTREKYTVQKTEFIISVLTSLGLDKIELSEIKNANL